MSSLNQIVEDKKPNVRINVNRNSRRRWEFDFETDVFVKCEKEETSEKEAHVSCWNKYNPPRTP
jgi:preprotein translocase subunit SecB